MLEAPGIKEKFFVWFIRPFARRPLADVPEGVTDEELIRRGELVQRRYTLLTYLTLVLVTLAVGGLYQLSGLGPERRADDLFLESNSPWPGAFCLAIGLCGLFAASPWAHLVGGKDVECDYRLAFEAKHKVNVRRMMFLCSLPLAALGAGVFWLCGDYIAFDRTALRWRQSTVEQARASTVDGNAPTGRPTTTVIASSCSGTAPSSCPSGTSTRAWASRAPLAPRSPRPPGCLHALTWMCCRWKRLGSRDKRRDG